MNYKTKIIVSLILAVYLLGVFNLQASAFWGKRKKQADEAASVEDKTQAADVKKGVQEKAPEPVVQKEPAKKRPSPEVIRAKREMVRRKRQQLNDSEWIISLKLSKAEGKQQEDVLTFVDNRVVSANFLKQGFTATNYTLSVEDDGLVVWETMQRSEDKGMVFWRGEIDVDMAQIQGVVSHHIDDLTTRDYSFNSINRKVIAPLPEE